jgi:hypothetical protein
MHCADRNAFRSRDGLAAKAQNPVSECPGSKLIHRATPFFFLLDNATLDAGEMWEAPFSSVAKLLVRTHSKARARGSLSVPEFKTVARRVWPGEPLVPAQDPERAVETSVRS